ncbi:MAG: DUF6515 family protein [Pseudomonadota bacterium]
MSIRLLRVFLAWLTIACGAFAWARPPAPPPPPGVAPPPYGLPGNGTRVDSGKHLGRRVDHLPGNPEAVQFNRGAYAFHRGRFYRVTVDGYEGVLPPVGIRVGKLPPDARRVGRQADRTYVYDGVVYRRVVGGYQVVSVSR